MLRIALPGNVSVDDRPDYLARFYRPVCRLHDSCPGVCSVYPFACSVIADVIPATTRNTYLARLEGFISLAFILGPALGGILGQVSNQFPFYAAGVISGIAMIAGFLFLKESNPLIVDEEGNYRAKKAGIA